MKNYTSKIDFINSLSFWSSFKFNSAECKQIIENYESQFYAGVCDGKEEWEICSLLGHPRKIIMNMHVKKRSIWERLQILFTNYIILSMLFIFVRFISELFLVYICRRRYFEYMYVPLIWNLLTFLFGRFLFRKSQKGTGMNYRTSHISIFGLAVIFFVIALFIIPRFNSVEGEICFMVMLLISITMMIWGLWFLLIKLPEGRKNAFGTILHLSGWISILLFAIIQFNLHYDSMAEHYYFVFQSAILYFEVIILLIFFHDFHVFGRKRQ